MTEEIEGPKFKPGDMVIHKTGGLRMVVCERTDARSMNVASAYSIPQNVYRCSWISGDHPVYHTFYECELVADQRNDDKIIYGR